MCQKVPIRLAGAIVGGVLFSTVLVGQGTTGDDGAIRPDWRRIGNSAVELRLASLATGPVDRVWFSVDGTRLFARTEFGKILETKDFESWSPNPAAEPPALDPRVDWAATLPESEARLQATSVPGGRLYGVASHIYRSDDGGRNWSNLTEHRRESIIGEQMRDLAISPVDGDHIVVANRRGVWRSLDGGLSWIGLNDSLPNLPVRSILSTPVESRGARILAAGVGPVEWAPGEKVAWRPAADPWYEEQAAALVAARLQLGESVSAVAVSESVSYAGARNGRLWFARNGGLRWQSAASPARGPVTALYLVPGDPRIAVAAVGAGVDDPGAPRVLRTINGGLLWEDLTANLPFGNVRGVTVDRQSGAVYAATDQGLFLTLTDQAGSVMAADWIPVGGNLPQAPASDVKLDPAGNQIYVAVEGYGVYAAPAPHRFWNLRVVNAADFSARPAAPGSLLSVLGGRIVRAQAGFLDAPILHASELESQIQIPFEAGGRSTRLDLEAPRGRFTFDLPLREVSPAIFVDRDGTPLLLDGDSGLVLDALNPARSGGRVQVLAAGLGKVQPAWPTGRAAPLDAPPKVVAPVRVFLDGVPVEVTHATLAPGYVGFYLVEIRLPAIVNYGPSELKLESGGAESNRVRIYLEP